MSRTGQLQVIVVDVGPHAMPVIPYVSDALTDLVMQKIIAKSKAQLLAVVLYGSNATDNGLYEAGEEPYANIEVLPLKYVEAKVVDDEDENIPPRYDKGFTRCDTETLRQVRELGGRVATEAVRVDVVDALVVALDFLLRESEVYPASYTKKVLLLSPLANATQVADEELQTITQNFAMHRITLEVQALPLPDGSLEEERAACMQLLDSVSQFATCRCHIVHAHTDVLHLFKAKEVSNTSTANLMLDIADGQLRIPVKMCLKTERRDSSLMSCERVVKAGDNRYNQTTREGTLKYVEEDGGEEGEDGDPTSSDALDKTLQDEAIMGVQQENAVSMYKYGNHVVALEDNVGKYVPDKGAQLYGFLDENIIPRHYYMTTMRALVADGSNRSGVRAMSALVRGMAEKEVHGVLRLVSRDKVLIMAAIPMVGDVREGRADYLLLAQLPFTDDIRKAQFDSFDKEMPTFRSELMPDEEQCKLMQELVKELDLNAGKEQHLKCDEMVDPVVHRFMQAVAARALDPNAQVEGVAAQLVECTLQPPPKVLAKAKDALAKLPELFKKACGTALQTQQTQHDGDGLPEAAFNPADWVERIGTAAPVDDFQAMLAQAAGKSDIINCAFQGLEAAIRELVDNSIGNKLYGKALSALNALRDGAIQLDRPTLFNNTLQALNNSYSQASMRKPFWRSVLEAGVTMVHKGESGGSNFTSEEAQHWLKERLQELKVQPAAQAQLSVNQEDPDDEFEDME